MTVPELSAAFVIGLAGAGHCLGMCGGITAALGLGGNTRATITAGYHCGRLLSYTALGAAAGYLAAIPDVASWTIVLRFCAGLLMVAMGLYIADWWRGLQWLERGGAYLWRPVQALAKPLIPVRNVPQALGLGLCWGVMPCGLIYSALALAATRQSVTGSAVLMLCFGLGTLPAMVLASVGASRLQNLLRARGLRLALALLLIAGGIWSLYITTAHSAHLLSSPTTEPALEHQHH